MTPRQISQRLNLSADAVCRYLLPEGRKSGHDWTVGNVDGAAGDSLRVCVSGSKTGVGADFATGETFGDLLDLWMAVRGCDLKSAMDQALSFLGVVPDGRDSRPRKSWRRPERPKDARKVAAEPGALAYLSGRGLSAATLAAYQVAAGKVAAHFGEELRNGLLTDPNGAVLMFPYKRDNELMNCKYLAVERTADGKKLIRQERQCEPTLFGWQAMTGRERTVALTEGEIDAMSLYEMGIPALSVPNGGGGGRKQDWIESDFDHLERFDVLYLCLDDDEPGREAAAEIVRRLGAERCRAVKLPGKDANECLMAGYGKADFARWIAEARSIDPEELKPATSFLGAVLHEFFPAPGEPTGLPLPWSKTENKFVLRRSEVTLWTGINGHGKSLLLSHIIAHAMSRGERACVASMEMPPARTLHRMVKQVAATGTPTDSEVRRSVQWLDERLWLFDVLGTAKIDRLLEVFAYAARRYGISQFVIDSLAKLGMAEDDYSGQKALVEALVDFSHRYGPHVHLVAHSRKGQDEANPPGKMDVKGTGALTDLVDNVASVWRNKRKEEQVSRLEEAGNAPGSDLAGKPDAMILISKQRYSGWEGEIWLWFDPSSLQYLERRESAPVRYLAASPRPDLRVVGGSAP